MKIYLVGGAVRDELLKLPIKERDWVVVGATIDDMRARGYKQVGKDFPVFLHPDTNEEYALARVERKIKPGYKGFTFNSSLNVTLEEDLSRRDLTINAMAKDENGKIIDPFHGQDDLKHKLLKHVSPAFAEDPVRILRIGRFAARYHHLGFHVAPETNFLMEQMVEAGEVDALVAERVFKELERALAEQHPEQFFFVLHDCHALSRLFPDLKPNGNGIKALHVAAKVTPDPVIRFATLLYDYPEKTEATRPKTAAGTKQAIAQLCRHYRIPNQYRELATLTALHTETAFNAENLTPFELLQLLSDLDVFRREERFHSFIIACHAIAKALGNQSWNGNWLTETMRVAKDVDVQALITKGLNGDELASELKEQRMRRLNNWMHFKNE